MLRLLDQASRVLLWEPRVVWYAVLFPMALWIMVAWVPADASREARLRTTASVLQIAGILVVAWGLHRLRIELGQPTLRSVWRAWWWKVQQLFGRRGTVVNMAGTARASGARAYGRAHVRMVDRSTIEGRVAELEHEVGRLQTELNARFANVEERFKAATTELQTENVSRRKETRELRELLDRVLIGGLDLEAAGLAWILVGEALEAWPRLFDGLAKVLAPWTA